MTVDLGTQTCRVSGRFFRSAIDGKDADRRTDGIPWAGLRITFQASIASVNNIGLDPATLITLDPIIAYTDSDGVMVSPDGEPNVEVIATDDPMLRPTGTWYYVATVEGTGFPTKRISFVAPGNGTYDLIRDQEIPLDLASDLVAWEQAYLKVKNLIDGFDGTFVTVLG